MSLLENNIGWGRIVLSALVHILTGKNKREKTANA